MGLPLTDTSAGADLPIEQASKFILVLNLKTAKSLGIAPPDRPLTVADEVVE